MPTPDFILELRSKIGHDLLPLIGVSAVIVDDAGRVLLTRRRDSGRWSLLGGIVEPGEDPSPAVLREIEEETGLVAAIDRLVSVLADPPVAYPNGDRVQFLTFSYRCRPVRGEAVVADDENLEVAWFDLDAMPELSAVQQERLHRALAAPAPTIMRTA